MSKREDALIQENSVLRDLVRECERELDLARGERDGYRIALQAAETKIESMETVHQRMLGWQDCAREVMRRQGNPQATAVPDISQLLERIKC